MTPQSKILALAAALLAAGCQASYKHTLNFNPSEPLRIAVLPFAQVDSDGNLVRADESLLIDSVALISSRQRETPAQFMQSLVQSELSNASLDVITPAIVEADLLHNGFSTREGSGVTVDLNKLFATDAQTLCGKMLACDAVMYGKVTRWDRSYYGIQSVATVAIRLTLVSAKGNKVLYDIEAQDADSRGITKGPTGFSNLAIEPLRGLDSAIIQNLARDVADKAIEPLSSRGRPEFLKAAPPFIIASGHDAFEGRIPEGGKVVVVAFGSPKQIATFSVGHIASGIPMLERAPGHYVGEFIPLSSDSFADQHIVVSLMDEFRRTTSQKLSRSAVSYR